jgi:hypothetical protein
LASKVKGGLQLLVDEGFGVGLSVGFSGVRFRLIGVVGAVAVVVEVAVAFAGGVAVARATAIWLVSGNFAGAVVTRPDVVPALDGS